MKANCCICGTEIDRPPAHLARNTKGVFCSHRCHSEGQKGEGNATYRGKVSLTCERCGRSYEVYPSAAVQKGKPRRFCSGKCQTENARENPPRRIGPSQRKCPRCGVSFLVPAVRRNHARVFCSRICANLAHRAYIRGSKNGRYVHGQGREEYPPEFKKIAPKIRKRDEYRCRLCAKRQPGGARGTAVFAVHHIDSDKMNNDPGNLITLCRNCHATVHGLPARRAKWAAVLSSLLNPSPHPPSSTTFGSPSITTTSPPVS